MGKTTKNGTHQRSPRIVLSRRNQKIKFGGEKCEVGERIGVEDRSGGEGLLTKCER